MHPHRRSSLAAAAVSFMAASFVHAAQPTQFTPQGTVGEADHVLVVFDEPVVALGAKARAPVALQCNGQRVAGDGRWLDQRQWRFDFQTPPAAGVQCRAVPSPDFRDLAGRSVTVTDTMAFEVAGAQVSSIRPISYDRAEVDEDQVFALWFNHAVSAQTMMRATYCQVEGLGERVPVRLIDGDDRAQLLEALYADEGETPDRLHLVQCARRLPPDAAVSLTVASPGGAGAAQSFDYTVRSPFRAWLSCARERAGAPCLPLGDLTLMFSAPVAVDQARQVRLATSQGDRGPLLDTPDDVQADVVSFLRFKGPFAEGDTLTLSVPAGLADDSGRALLNAAEFPLSIPLSDAPPLVKFAAGTFGVVERFGHADADAQTPPLVPVTVRYVEPGLRSQALTVSAGRLGRQVVQDDRDALQWYARVRRLDDAQWTAAQLSDIMAGREPRQDNDSRIDTRSYAMLANQPDTQWQDLPGVQDGPMRPFEVIGVPVSEPGLHVMEIGSDRLGRFLLDAPATAYVRSLALVTNLGVHLKEGRGDVLVWVTTLDQGEPVEGARVRLLDCRGDVLADGVTDAQGVWQSERRWDAPSWCQDTGLSGLYASARIPADHPQARGAADFSFVMSDWDRGIEAWRFNVPTDYSPQRDRVLHTVFDRSLLRRGDTVSMRHYLREQTRDGLTVPALDNALPDQLRIRHQGSGEETVLPLSWQRTPSGGLSATSSYRIGDADRLGEYAVSASGESYWYEAAGFQVEDFTPPLMTGQLQLRDVNGQATLVAPQQVRADVTLGYVAGGAAGGLNVTVSAVARDADPAVPGHDGFVFDPPRDGPPDGQPAVPVVLLDKQPLTLDAGGAGQLVLGDLPAVTRQQSWLFEVNYPDPNGQVQTLSQRVPVRPAAVQAGIKVPGWTAGDQPIVLQALAVDEHGQAQAGVPLRVEAYAHRTYTTRQRLVGGYYRYEHQRRTEPLGEQCAGVADERGQLLCEVSLSHRGEIEWRVQAADAQGRVSVAAATGWLTGDDDLWFSASSDDRMDVVPSQTAYRAGEAAEFQVRMPFREATALVTVEREGILWRDVIELDGANPVIRVPVQAGWGPNVYVSVLALRGRVRSLGWRSFLDWGWRQPVAWLDAYRRPAPPAPTAVTDLARPSFRFGLAGIQVHDDSDRLTVKVEPDQAQYRVRDRATVRIQVTGADGQPAPAATVALAAVDQSLLELAPNDSWDLLQAMRGVRSHGVRTGTAQSEIVGRRHYGRKALPAGGGGGRRPSRELLDTLLYWQPALVTDAQGRAEVVMPLNDALTRFELAAVADHGADRFGTGRASFVSTQDLQLLPGLPAHVREGDHYDALLTVRNTTDRLMRVAVRAEAPGLPALAPQAVDVPPGGSTLVRWPVTVPVLTSGAGQQVFTWRFDARAQEGQPPAADALTWTQRIAPAVPVRAQQATLVAVRGGERAASLPIEVPAGLQVGADGQARGGVQVSWRASLAGGLDGVQAWFADYPYTCFEQQASRWLTLRDQAGWQALLARLPALMDGDGLARYFPGGGQGSVVLTAYLLTISHEAQTLGWTQVLPAEARDAMLAALAAFVEGRLTTPQAAGQAGDLIRLQAIEALSRYRRAHARMLDTVTVAPQRWPASALVDWLSIQKRVPGIRQGAALREQARHALLARLTGGATQRVLDTRAHPEPWDMMRDEATALASLVLATVDDPAWRQEQPLMVLGLLSLQRRGAWRTTTANALGTLALARHAGRFEEGGTQGTATALMAGAGQQVSASWPNPGGAGASVVGTLPWPPGQDTLVLTPPDHGPAWATVSLQGAVAAQEPVQSGYRVERRIEAVTQARPGQWTRGDVYRVVLTIEARTPAGWVVVHDPIPAGAAILGGGLGRDSALAAAPSENEPPTVFPAYIERGADAFQAYFDGLPAGRHEVRYSVRLNTPGEFRLPATRVEALYQPDLFAEYPQPPMRVLADD